MKSFFVIMVMTLLLSACSGTVVYVEVQHHVKTPPGYLSEEEQHRIARRVGEFSRPRWGYPGGRLGSVSRMLSAYMRMPMWCFEDRVAGIRVAKCTTKAHLDSVPPYRQVYFRYVYMPQARDAGIAIPVFIDDWYLCRRWCW